MSHTWVWASNGNVPANAVQAGVDKDGGKLFIGRARHQCDLLPAKIVPNHRTSYVSYNGKEISVPNYEALCNCQSTISWTTASGGCVPHGALAVGKTSSGECLYMGRTFHEGTLTLGKVHPSHNVCYIPYNGKEIAYKQYEVLTLRSHCC